MQKRAKEMSTYIECGLIRLSLSYIIGYGSIKASPTVTFYYQNIGTTQTTYHISASFNSIFGLYSRLQLFIKGCKNESRIRVKCENGKILK